MAAIRSFALNTSVNFGPVQKNIWTSTKKGRGRVLCQDRLCAVKTWHKHILCSVWWHWSTQLQT